MVAFASSILVISSIILFNIISLLFAMNMNGKEVKHCSLCFHNGEPEDFCSSHNLKTRDGRIVTCPVLRKYVCNLCSASGDHAHTLRYCPLNKDGVFSRGASLPQLKTRRNAAGNFSNRKYSNRMLCPPLHSALRKEENDYSQVRMLEAEARRLRAHYFTLPPPALHTHANSPALHTPANSTFGYSQTPGFGHMRAISPPSFANSYGSFSSSPESVCSNSTHSSPGRDAASPWVRPTTVKTGSWASRSTGASAFTTHQACRHLTPKMDYQRTFGGEVVEDVGKLLAELRLGTTPVEM